MQLSQLSWPAIARLNKGIVVVIPIAAVEQHGPHLPVYTDSMLLGEIVRRVELSMGDAILTAPLMWLGNSHHHMDFAGTLSASPRVYLDLLVSLMDNLLDHGFRRLVLLNGHGGNDVPARQAIFEVRQKYRQRNDLLLLAATYWNFGAWAARANFSFVQKDMGHACEWETSMMLRIAPELVGDYQSLAAVEPGSAFAPASRAWTTKDRSQPGYIGWPSSASAEKGESLFADFSEGVMRLLKEVQNWDGKSWDESPR